MSIEHQSEINSLIKTLEDLLSATDHKIDCKPGNLDRQYLLDVARVIKTNLYLLDNIDDYIQKVKSNTEHQISELNDEIDDLRQIIDSIRNLTQYY